MKFELDQNVPANLLPKNGKYRANITKLEVGATKTGAPMIKVQLTIPATEPAMVAQNFSSASTVFDNILPAHDAIPCKIKANNFIESMELEGKDDSAFSELIGKSVEVKVRQRSDDYGDKLEVTGYVKGSLKSAADIPF